MKCEKCGYENEDEAKFCNQCGLKLYEKIDDDLTENNNENNIEFRTTKYKSTYKKKIRIGIRIGLIITLLIILMGFAYPYYDNYMYLHMPQSVVASNDKYKVDIKMSVDKKGNPVINKNGLTKVTVINNNSNYINNMSVTFKLLDNDNNEIDDDTYGDWSLPSKSETVHSLSLEKFKSDGCHIEVQIKTATADNGSDSSKDNSQTTKSYNNDKNLRSGQSIVLNKDTMVCSSKDNLDKMLSFLNANNKESATNMLLNGQATMLSKGTKVNVIDSGITVTKIETSDGITWFAPRETIQDAL